MKIFKHKKAFVWAIPWAVLGLISLANIWLLKKPSAETGFFGSVPLVGWIAGILVLIIIIRSRR